MAAAPIIDSEVIEGLREFPFFQRFPEDLLEPLARLAHYRVIGAGDLLIEQGQVNSHLYILVQGEVQVLVDGAPVAELTTPGDLIGEMSLITGRPASATIMGLTDVEAYCLNVNELNHLKGESQDRIHHLLYRIYSQVLSQKMEQTNEKAKRLEITLARLEATKDELEVLNQSLEDKVKERTAEIAHKNSELILSHRKLEELYTNRTTTMAQLQKLYENHLLPLHKAMSAPEFVSSAAPEVNDKVNAELARTIRLLEPISRLYSTEQVMRAHRVLVLDSNRKQQLAAKMALGGTGVEIGLASQPEEALSLLNEGHYHILFVSPDFLAFADQFQQINPLGRVVLMTSQPIPEYLPDLGRLNAMPNLVSRSDEDRTFTIKNIVTTVGKLAGGDIFGLEKYLAWGVELHEEEIRSSEERSALIGQMKEKFEGLGIRTSIRDRASLVAEELLMNAIYDAPVDQQGHSLYNHLPRTVEVQLKAEHFGRFRFASDGILAAVSVEDPFGALNGQTILKYLESCYGGQAGSLNQHKGGAGRGLHQIVESSDLVVFNLHPGHRTEVIALFNLDPKAGAASYPTFHLFIL